MAFFLLILRFLEGATVFEVAVWEIFEKDEFVPMPDDIDEDIEATLPCDDT